MPVEKGSAFLLKIGNGATPLVYATVAGLRTTQLTIAGETVVITNKGRAAGANCCRARACVRSACRARGSSPDPPPSSA